MKRIAKGSSFALGVAVLFWQASLYAHANTFYLTNPSNNTVNVFNSSGSGRLPYATFTFDLSNPGGIAIAGSNSVYVANYGNNTIMVFNTNGTSDSVFANTGLNEPTGLAFDKSGNLYAANYGSNTIEKFNSSGQGTLFASNGLNGPVGIAFDPQGNLYAANYGNGTIEEFGSNGVGSVFATGLSQPWGLAFDSHGNLYVSNNGSFSAWIEKYNSNGVGSVFAGNLNPFPAALAFDAADNLYVTFPYYGVTEKFNTNGTGSIFISDSEPGGAGLAIQFSQLVVGCPTNPPCTNILGQCFMSTNTMYGGNGAGVIPFYVNSNVTANPPFVPYSLGRHDYLNIQALGELDFGGDWGSNLVAGCGCSVSDGEMFQPPHGRQSITESFSQRLATNPYVVMPVASPVNPNVITVTGFVWAKILSVAGVDGNPTLTFENVTPCGNQVPPPDGSSVLVSNACGGVYAVTVDPDVISNQTCPSHYTITRTYHATDPCGNTGSISQIITVNDTTPPVIDCPGTVTVSTDAGKCTASNVNLGTPSVFSSCSGPVTLSNNAPSIFQKGTTHVIWTAIDPCGIMATCTQIVTVVDNQLPSITCPAPVAVSCASAMPSPNPGSIVATDNCGSVTVTFVSDTITNQSCPDRYTVLRVYKATDSANNSVTCTQTITVNSTVAPGITAPADVAVGTDAGQCYASNVALGSPVTFSPCGGALTITNNAPAVFPKGNTQVIWSATDSCGNSSNVTQNVLVVDNQPPLVACPSNILVNAQDTNGAIVAFSVTAADNCDSNLVASCSPVSGSEFAIGTTPVNCVVVDSVGNTNTCSFNVTVVDPSVFNILSVSAQNSDVALSWVMPLGLTGVVQGSADSLSNDFADVSGPFYAPGSGSITNNYLDTGAQTNFPQRFYRIRLTP